MSNNPLKNNPLKFVLPNVFMSGDEIKGCVPLPNWESPAFIRIDATIHYGFYGLEFSDFSAQGFMNVLTKAVCQKIGVSPKLLKSSWWNRVNCENDQFVFVVISNYDIKKSEIKD